MTTEELDPPEDTTMNRMSELVGPYRPTQSEDIGELAKALAAAQGEMESAERSSANPFFKSRYADLAADWDACRGSLSKHSLAVSRPPSPAQTPRPLPSSPPWPTPPASGSGAP